MNISKNFTLEEMLRSASATRKGYKEQFAPPDHIVQNLTALAVNILQPLRDELRQSIFISSGYRCERLNTDVGGAKNSQHMTGEAADLQATGTMSNKVIFETIKKLKLPYDQLIWEFGDQNEPAWVHVSFGKRNRREILYIGK